MTTVVEDKTCAHCALDDVNTIPYLYPGSGQGGEYRTVWLHPLKCASRFHRDYWSRAGTEGNVMGKASRTKWERREKNPKWVEAQKRRVSEFVREGVESIRKPPSHEKRG